MTNIIIPGGGRLGPPSNDARAAGALVTAVYQAVEHGRNQVSCVPGLLKRVLDEGSWRSFSLPHSSRIIHSYPTFQAFVDDWLHLTTDELRATCEFAMTIQRRNCQPRDADRDRETLRLLDLAVKGGTTTSQENRPHDVVQTVLPFDQKAAAGSKAGDDD